MAGDAIEVKKLVDKPQGEFWGYQTEGNYDIKECSSAAHAYGKQIASGEAFTDITYKHSLSDIKNLADYAYAFGINEFVVCAVAFQKEKGIVNSEKFASAAPFAEGKEVANSSLFTNTSSFINTANGRQYVLNRLNTLWPASKPFWDYQARCSWMLRQGKPVADVAVYLGDNLPARIVSHKLPPLPQGYDFDAIGTDVLLHRLTASNGRLVLPDGVSYRLLVLPGDEELTAEVRQRVDEWRRQGIPVYDPRGELSFAEDFRLAGLQPDVEAPAAKRLYFCHRRITDSVQHSTFNVQCSTFNVQCSTFNVQCSMFNVQCSMFNVQCTDIYFLNNHSDETVNDRFLFRTAATSAELWNAVTGERTPLAMTIEDGRTAIDLTFAPRESYFIILKSLSPKSLSPKSLSPDPSPKSLSPDPSPKERGVGILATGVGNSSPLLGRGVGGEAFGRGVGGEALGRGVGGEALGRGVGGEAFGGEASLGEASLGEAPWTVQFGPTEPVTFDKLGDWTQHSDPRIKYFSGTAVCKTTFTLKKKDRQAHYRLSVPLLNAAAEVIVNGQSAGIVWCSPWNIDITRQLKKGKNQIELRICNTLWNRLVGDANRPEAERIMQQTTPLAKPTDKLVPSGVNGTVEVICRL